MTFSGAFFINYHFSFGKHLCIRRLLNYCHVKKLVIDIIVIGTFVRTKKANLVCLQDSEVQDVAGSC